jgi:long-chain fatty acid transport protein
MGNPVSLRIALATCLVLTPLAALATNGMNMIGYNARSSGLGGADVALDHDCPGCNPATLGSTGPRSLSGGIGLLLPRVELHNTLLGPNDVDSDDTVYSAPYVEYAQTAGPDSPWTLGFVLLAQGGLGVDFDGVRTFAGTVDSFSTDVQFARAMPTAAFRVNEQLSLGASLLIGYTRQTFELFPNTYSPGPDGLPGTPDDFAGTRIEDLSGTGFAGRVGAHYRVNDRLSLGLTYTSETSLDLDDGDLTMNLGFAQVGYDAEMDDFAWPSEMEAGFAFEATPRLTLVGDVRWIGWSSAIDELVVRGSNPDTPVPLTNPEIPLTLKWNDQWVFAVGAEFALTPRHTARLGYNYGESPVPDEYALPMFPATVERHVTVGYALNLKDVRVDVAWEHSLTHTQRNTNPNLAENPFGPDAEVIANNGDVLHLGVTYRF